MGFPFSENNAFYLLADVVGVENALKVCKVFAGKHFYIPSLPAVRDRLLAEAVFYMRKVEELSEAEVWRRTHIKPHKMEKLIKEYERSYQRTIFPTLALYLRRPDAFQKYLGVKIDPAALINWEKRKRKGGKYVTSSNSKTRG